MKKFQYGCAVLVALAMIAPLLLSACGSSVAATADDATITTRVKTVLVTDPAVEVARIEVSTFKGIVTLSGRVKSKDDEAKAIALARTIKGVSDVKSALQILP
jgi:osmotically-inducible protein OsmY